MNRPLVLLAMLFSATVLLAQTYVDIDEVSGSALLRLAKIDDFAALAKERKIKTIFRTRDQFVLQVDSILYIIESAGFKTIQDYRAGRDLFETGERYYVALAHGLASKSEVDYFNRELFLTGDDFRRARKAGFVESGIAEKPRGISGLLRKEDLKRALFAANGLLAAKRRLGLGEPSVDDLAANASLAYLVNSSFGSILAVTDDLYYLSISTDWLRKPEGSAVGGKGAAVKPEAAPDSDAVFYYLAVLGKYADPSEARAAVLSSGTQRAVMTIRDTEKLLAASAFRNLPQVPQAVARGFSDGREFNLAVEYNLADRAEYAEAEDRIAMYEKLRAKYDLKSKGEAAVVRKLLDLPKRVPVSFARFAEQYNKEQAADPLLKRFDFRMTESSVAAILGRSKSLADEFVYDKEGKSLYRK